MKGNPGIWIGHILAIALVVIGYFKTAYVSALATTVFQQMTAEVSGLWFVLVAILIELFVISTKIGKH